MSINFRAKITLKNDLRKYKSFGESMVEVARQANALAGLEIRNEAIDLIKQNSDGTKVTRYLPKREVFASKPGNPPNADTGRLMQSIKVERDGKATLVGTNLRYGAHLEFGTKDMEPRPWLSVALAKVAGRLIEIYEIAYKNVLGNLK